MKKVTPEKSKKGRISPLKPTAGNRHKQQNEVDANGKKSSDGEQVIYKSDNMAKSSIYAAQDDKGQFASVDVFHWIMYRLALPLILILVPALLYCIYPRTRQAYRHLLDDGVLLIFSGLLLLGVQGMLEQTRSTVSRRDLDKALSHWATFMLVLGIAILSMYAFNSNINTLTELKVLPSKDFAGAETKWILLGAVVTLVSTIFSLAAVYHNNRTLLLLHHRRDNDSC